MRGEQEVRLRLNPADEAAFLSLQALQSGLEAPGVHPVVLPSPHLVLGRLHPRRRPFDLNTLPLPVGSIGGFFTGLREDGPGLRGDGSSRAVVVEVQSSDALNRLLDNMRQLDIPAEEPTRLLTFKLFAPSDLTGCQTLLDSINSSRLTEQSLSDPTLLELKSKPNEAGVGEFRGAYLELVELNNGRWVRLSKRRLVPRLAASSCATRGISSITTCFKSMWRRLTRQNR